MWLVGREFSVLWSHSDGGLVRAAATAAAVTVAGDCTHQVKNETQRMRPREGFPCHSSTRGQRQNALPKIR